MNQAKTDDAVPTPKVLVYVIAHGHLLVHTHADFPDAGLQVPAGSIEPTEDPIVAARRELFEESGLAPTEEAIVIYRTEYFATWANRVHDRFFVAIQSDLPRNDFRHVVSEGSEDKGLVLDYTWIPLAEAVLTLTADQGAGIEFL